MKTSTRPTLDFPPPLIGSVDAVDAVAPSPRRAVSREVVEGPAELDELRRRYNREGRPTPEVELEYLQGCTGVIYRDATGEVIAQYLIKRSPALRIARLLAEDARAEPFVSILADAAEFTGFWMHPDLHRLDRFKIYVRGQLDFVSYADRRWLLVATERPSLRARYRFLYSKEMWMAPAIRGDVNSQTRGWSVSGLERWKLLPILVLWGIPRMFIFQLIGQGRRRGFSKANRSAA